MKLIVLTPEKEIYKGEVKSVQVPGINGGFEILNNHAPIVAALGSGRIKITDVLGSGKVFTIKKGFVEVLKNDVSLLVQGVDE